jgi:hypothetical protein
MSTILDSNIVDAQDQNLPTHEFHSLLQKMNIGQCLIFYDVMFKKNKIINEPLHSFITRGVSTCKTFMLMLLIQGLLRLYNKHLRSNLSKRKALLMAYTRKTTFNIDGITIH